MSHTSFDEKELNDVKNCCRVPPLVAVTVFYDATIRWRQTQKCSNQMEANVRKQQNNSRTVERGNLR